VGVDGLQQDGGKAVVFEEMAEIEDGGLVRQGVSYIGKARKAARTVDFVERGLPSGGRRS
jgi:hypothetical protein